MTYYEKYLKYKNKYMMLRNQLGGNNIKIIDIETKREYIVENRIKIETQLNKLIQENKLGIFTRDELMHIGDLLYYGNRGDIELSKIKYDEMMQIIESIDNPQFVKKEVELPEIDKSEPTNDVGLRLLRELGLKNKYYDNSEKSIKDRLYFLNGFFNNDKKKAIITFNEEKLKYHTYLKELDDKLKRTAIKIKYDKEHIMTNYKDRSTMSEYSDMLIYKEIMPINKSITVNTANILFCIDFIEKCQNIIANFNSKHFDKYKIKFVNILPKLIILNKSPDTLSFGYLMEVVDGITVRDFKEQNEKEFNDIIIPAIHSLVDTLTELDFLIMDFALDNIMWNTATKTLTYIDINPLSFERRTEAQQFNEGVKYQPLN
jgi:hypothetical protein